MRRVVITGQGTINALGRNVGETFEAFRAAKCAIGPLDFEDVERLSIRIGAQIHGYLDTDHFSSQELGLLDRAAQFALIAAKEAVQQSGLTFGDPLAERSGVILGTAGGGMETTQAAYRDVFEAQKSRVHPFTVPRLMHNSATSQISIKYGLKGPGFSVSSACASSNHAMGQAFQAIKSGAADVILTGGSEAMLCFGGVKAWEGLRVLSPDGCRPFSRDRNGMVMGEGAAIFVFEDYEHARNRDANILAEVAGFSMCSDACDIVLPSKSGAVRAMQGALRDGNLAPDDIDYINAHGTGTRANDRTEAAAIEEVFGAHRDTLAVSSSKSMHGHLIGAAGAVELLACVLALREGVVAPTIGFNAVDPECRLDVVPNAAREQTVKATLSNAFAFGGLNAVVALKMI